MIELQTLANIAEIVGLSTVVFGIGFALIQLREYRRQRRDYVTAELMRSFYNPDLGRAVRMLRELPDGLSSRDLRDRGAEYEEAAILVTTTLETMGLLVHRHIAEFWIVHDLCGGLTNTMWNKLSRWTHDVRQEQSQPSWGEWFQWLAERLRDFGGDEVIAPAHERFTGWRPRT